VKPRRIDFDGAHTRRDIIERVLRTRLTEAVDLAPALNRRERQALHDFRIACKRLRYALERFTNGDAAFERAAERLADVQDALGAVHDRDVLLTILPPNMPETERRLMRDREDCVDRAEREWNSIVPGLRRTPQAV
jgi:CHAD domain-containing protein